MDVPCFHRFAVRPRSHQDHAFAEPLPWSRRECHCHSRPRNSMRAREVLRGPPLPAARTAWWKPAATACTPLPWWEQYCWR